MKNSCIPSTSNGMIQPSLEELVSFTCEICVEPTLSNRKFKNKNICTHPFCNDCVIKYIKVKIEYDNAGTIKCPGLGCDRNLDILSCRSVLPEKLFERWCDILCEEAVLGLDYCYCPNRYCSTLMVNECGGVVNRTICIKCKQAFCFKCKIAWHAGFTCEESGQFKDANEVAFGVLAELRRWKRCPKCKIWVQLASGCFNVICRCGRAFVTNAGKRGVNARNGAGFIVE